jgi:dipeptidase
MCDTVVALGNATKDGSVIFAKNSDRDANEIQELQFVPHLYHPNDSYLRCTYISIPQVKETNAIILSKPFWIWGAEIGANEHGVVIGNEALFTKVKYEKEPGLTGMDFLRLALERANNAYDAVKVIINLLELYGQGGNCGFSKFSYYHNSFIIADLKDAWVLETAGRQWAAKQVKDVYAISNKITIKKDWDKASKNLVDYAVTKGWCKNSNEFSFTRCYSNHVKTRLCYAKARQERSINLLNENKGKITITTMMNILRDHGVRDKLKWLHSRDLTGLNNCMHIGWGPIKQGQTTGSMVSHLKPELQTHWVTGSSAPCTGIFKPVWIDTGYPEEYRKKRNPNDKKHYWWIHEKLNRLVMLDYNNRIKSYSSKRDELENKYIKEVDGLNKTNVAERTKLTDMCFHEAINETIKWISKIPTSLKTKKTIFYMNRWKKLNQQAKLKL